MSIFLRKSGDFSFGRVHIDPSTLPKALTQICRVRYQLHRLPQLVKNLPAMQETWVRPLGWEDTLEKGKATHSSFLAWRIPWTA